MTTATGQHWRKRHGLAQVDAAAPLGISQPYLSLVENGARPLTASLRSRMKLLRRPDRAEFAVDAALRAQLRDSANNKSPIVHGRTKAHKSVAAAAGMVTNHLRRPASRSRHAS